METLKPLLLLAIQNIAEVEVSYYLCAHSTYLATTLSVQVCLAGLGLVGDLCRNLSKLIEPHCPELIQAMFNVIAVSILCCSLLLCGEYNTPGRPLLHIAL